jgi:AcrR family transcriptional regulator
VSTPPPPTPSVGGTRTRLAPERRREQLLDLGVRMLGTRTVDELSIELLAEEAGISRGLLYHYFRSKQEFHRAVVRRAADEVIAVTAPPVDGEPLERLAAARVADVDYVWVHYEGYASLVRGAASGDPALREIYEETRDALTARIFDATGGAGLPSIGIGDTPAARLMARGWSALTEEVVLSWVQAGRSGDEAAQVSREDLLALLTAALPGVLEATG